MRTGGLRYFWFGLFAVTFASFSLVQEYLRPNYSGESVVIIYALGVAPNFLPGIGLPAMLHFCIPEFFRASSFVYKNNLNISIAVSMFGLIANEFATLVTLGKGVFDWNDILWTLIGGALFYFIYLVVNKWCTFTQPQR